MSKVGLSKQEFRILLCVCLAQFAVAADNITTSLLIKDIMVYFQVSISQGQIITSSYSVISAPIMIVSGVLGYFFCWKKTFQLGLAMCVVGEFSALFIHDFYLFIGFSRLLFGIGAALALAASVALLTTRIEAKNRMFAFSIWATSVAVITLLSPMILVLIASVDWKMSFLFLALIPSIAWLLSLSIKSATPLETNKKIDPISIILIVSIVGLALVGISLLPSLGLFNSDKASLLDGLSWPSMIFIAVLALVIAFFINEKKKSKQACSYLEIIPKSCINIKTIAALYMLLFLYVIYGGVLFSIVSYMSLGPYSKAQTGIAVTAFALPMCLASILIASKGKSVSIVKLNIFGLFILAISLAALGWSITRTTSFLPLFLGMISIGIGCGVIASKSNIAVNNSVIASLSAQLSGLQVSVRNIGYVIGIAVFSSALSFLTKNNLIDSYVFANNHLNLPIEKLDFLSTALGFMSNNNLISMLEDHHFLIPANIEVLNNNARAYALQIALYASSLMCIISLLVGRMVANKPKSTAKAAQDPLLSNDLATVI